MFVHVPDDNHAVMQHVLYTSIRTCTCIYFNVQYHIFMYMDRLFNMIPQVTSKTQQGGSEFVVDQIRNEMESLVRPHFEYTEVLSYTCTCTLYIYVRLLPFTFCLALNH